MANNFDQLQSACRRIAEDCLYTAQTHFEKASASAKRAKGWLVLLPSLISAASGLAVAIGAPGWVGAFAAVAGVTSAVATYLGVDKEASTHEVAGKLLTQLRHESLALCDVHAYGMPVDQFASEVRALQNRYAAFVASLPLTDDDAFKKAQTKIRAGTFKYDSDLPVTPLTSEQALPAPKTED